MLAGCTTYFSIKTSQKFYLKCVFMHFIWFSGQTAIIPPHSINRFLFVIVTWYFCEVGTVYGCRDRLVEIATSYGPNGPGMESRWVGGGEFSRPVQTGSEVRLTSCTVSTRPFPGVQRPERRDDHPPPSSAGLRFCWSNISTSPPWLHRHVMGWPSENGYLHI